MLSPSQSSTSGSAVSQSPSNRKRARPDPSPPPLVEDLDCIPTLSGFSSGSGVAANHQTSSSGPQMGTPSPIPTVLLLQDSGSPGLTRSPRRKAGKRKKIGNLLMPEAPKKRKYSTGEESARNQTKHRVATAAQSVLGLAGDITHELLGLASDCLEFVPIPGLAPAARTLLLIWDALDDVDINATSCVRLTERCADTILAIRQEIHKAGDKVTEELHLPFKRLQETFDRVLRLMVGESTKPFYVRYLKRHDTMREIADCDTDVWQALNVFQVAVLARIHKQLIESDSQRQAENRKILAAVQQSQRPAGNAPMIIGTSGPVAASPQKPPQHVIPPPTVLSGPMSAEHFKSSIAQLRLAQDAIDRAQDAESLNSLIYVALQTTNDAEMLDLLQIERQDMPDTLKALQGALDQSVEHKQLEPQTPVVDNSPPMSQKMSMNVLGVGRSSPRKQAIDSWDSSSGSLGSTVEKDTLHRDFLKCGIATLTRMSRVETNLPSWTITKSEVVCDRKIGVGFFSDVYKGTWRGNAVAIKVLVDSTQHELFIREATIWNTLEHPNVLKLFGASSPYDNPSWFFVSPYLKNGNLGEFLRRIHKHMSSDIGKSSPQHATSNLPLSEVPRTGYHNFSQWGPVDSPRQPIFRPGYQATSPQWVPVNSPPQHTSGPERQATFPQWAPVDSPRQPISWPGQQATSPHHGPVNSPPRHISGPERQTTFPQWDPFVSPPQHVPGPERQATFSQWGPVDSPPQYVSEPGHQATPLQRGPIDLPPRNISGPERQATFPQWGPFDSPPQYVSRPGYQATSPPRGLVNSSPRHILGPERQTTLPQWGPVDLPPQYVSGPGPQATFPQCGPVDLPSRHILGPERQATFPQWGPADPPCQPISRPGYQVASPQPGPVDLPPRHLLGPERQATVPQWGPANLSPQPNFRSGHASPQPQRTPASLPPQPNSKWLPTGDPEDLRSRDLHRFIYEIAKGMSYLHDQNVCHGDLKAANVLVNDDLQCVISDFGESEMEAKASNNSSAIRHGTLSWQAPERMNGSSHLTKEMDVYSFSICCVEVLNWGSMPWEGTDDTIRDLVLRQNKRPPLPTGSTHVVPALRNLIEACWNREPSERPSFSKAVIEMRAIRGPAQMNSKDNSGHVSPLPGHLPDIDTQNSYRSPDSKPLPPLGSDNGQSQLLDFHNAYSRTGQFVQTPAIKFPVPLLFTPTPLGRQNSSSGPDGS